MVGVLQLAKLGKIWTYLTIRNTLATGNMECTHLVYCTIVLHLGARKQQQQGKVGKSLKAVQVFFYAGKDQ